MILELEKERGNWLDVSLQKESTLNQELQNEVKVANDSLEELRKNSFGELVKSCDILSLSEQRKVQDRMLVLIMLRTGWENIHIKDLWSWLVIFEFVKNN